MEENKLIYQFYHKDQFGQEYQSKVEVESDGEDNIISHLEQFKAFLLLMTYPPALVDRITYKEEE